MSTRTALFVLVLAIMSYGTIWVFNHVNAWAGIGSFILILATINYIFNKTTKNEKTN